MSLNYKYAGDRGIVIEFDNVISEKVNSQVRNMFLALEKNNIPGIEEIIPTYRSLLINYDPLKIKIEQLIEKLEKIAEHLDKLEIPEPKVVEIPTLYGGDYGPDLQFVAEHNQLSIEEVIKIHSSQKYLIYMLGFTPGFPYLGGMPEQIAAPRLDNPRVKIPAGSVGIAGEQTGIYPIESPGGWRLIGRTPLKLFNPESSQPFIFQAGDYLKFVPIDEKVYREIKEQVEKDEYQVNKSFL